MNKKRGIDFVPSSEVSDEAKKKIERLLESKKERLNKLVEDYNSGKLSMQ